MLTNRRWLSQKVNYVEIIGKKPQFEMIHFSFSVRSFGTEGRPTDRPVPPRDEIFEYIIFRGADIEDLQVREPPQNTLTQDPAIVEVYFTIDHYSQTSLLSF